MGLKTMRLNKVQLMISSFFVAIVFSVAASLIAAEVPAAVTAPATEKNLEIIISGIKKPTGNIIAAVYNKKKQWLGDDAYASAIVPTKQNLKDGSVVIRFALPAGEYAISVFHDRDGDEKMKTNFFGIPKDPMGLSNNAKARFGPPKYADAKFTIADKPLKMNIELGKI